MSAARKIISRFGTIEVASVKQLGPAKFEVIYKVDSNDPAALDMVGKAARSLNNRRFDCMNKKDSTILMHVVGSSFLTLLDAQHPFNTALFSALEKLVNPSTRGSLLRQF